MPKKIIFSTILALVLLSGVFFYIKKQAGKVEYKNLDLVTEVVNPIIYKDRDADGLKDWEEELWKTDPDNTDSDKDGTNDFEEIRLGRDPLIKGPDDKLDPESVKNKINPTIESDLNETEKFSRELFSRYISAKQNGDIMDGDYEGLLNSYREKNSSETTTIVYKKEDLKKVDSNSTSIKSYGNTLGKIIKEKSNKYPKNELVLLDEIIKNDPGTTAEFKEFADMAKRYGEIKEEMLKMEVPSSILDKHTEIINILGIMEVSTESMQFAFSDPVKTINTLSLYPYAVDILNLSFKDLGRYFIKNNVFFNSKEDGSLLTKGV
jgi:hypothetical protein